MASGHRAGKALNSLKIRAPRDFWGLTPRELALAFEGASGRTRGRPPERATLDRLMAAFPDAEDDNAR